VVVVVVVIRGGKEVYPVLICINNNDLDEFNETSCQQGISPPPATRKMTTMTSCPTGSWGVEKEEED
jgi:hypothetical protein